MEYNELENEAITLLNRKFNMLAEFLRVTKLVNLTASHDKFESEAEDYIFLIEKRENMIKEIISLNEKLKLPKFNNFDGSGNIAYIEEAKEINNKTDSLINEIIELDKFNNEKVQNIYKILKDSIKDINMGKNINTAYQNDLDYLDGGLYDYKS